MSYTMTLDMPETATAYVKRRGAHFHEQLNAIVLDFVMTQMRQGTATTALEKWDHLVEAGKGRISEPYHFCRADAYEEELG